MSDKMRRHMIAFWILLTLRVFTSHLALAAPVAVGENQEILEVRPDALGALKDGVVAWEKRMGSDNEDQWSSNEGHLPAKHADNSVPEDNQGNDPVHMDDGADSDYEGLIAGGSEDVGMFGAEPSWNWDDMRSNGRGPDPNHHRMSDSADNEVGAGKDKSSFSGSDGYSDGFNGYQSGYDADYDSDGDHSMQSLQGSIGNTSPGPQSEHPVTPESQAESPTFLEDLKEDISKGLPKFRPRNSGSGAVGTPKRELQGTVDSKCTSLSLLSLTT